MKIFHQQSARFSRQTAVVIMARNRYFLTRLFLASLKKSRLAEAMIILVDDASEEKTAALLRKFSMDDVPIVKVVLSEREHQAMAIHDILRLSWDLAMYHYGCCYLAVLDSDTVVQPGWFIRMQSIHRQHSQQASLLLVSGYNSKMHKTLAQKDGFCRKESLGGVSLLFSASLYCSVVRKNLVLDWDWSLVREINNLSGTMLAASPSVVQHLGFFGLHCGPFKMIDYSFDYPSWWSSLLQIPCCLLILLHHSLAVVNRQRILAKRFLGNALSQRRS